MRKPTKASGRFADGDGLADDFKFVAAAGAGVEGETSSGGCGGPDEGAAGDRSGSGGRCSNTLHDSGVSIEHECVAGMPGRVHGGSGGGMTVRNASRIEPVNEASRRRRAWAAAGKQGWTACW